MELLIIAVVVAVAALIYYNRASRKGLDLDQDGDIDLADVKIAVDNAKRGAAADIVKVKTAAKTAAKKAAAKKAPAKKPAAKKAPAQKPAARKK